MQKVQGENKVHSQRQYEKFQKINLTDIPQRTIGDIPHGKMKLMNKFHFVTKVPSPSHIWSTCCKGNHRYVTRARLIGMINISFSSWLSQLQVYLRYEVKNNSSPRRSIACEEQNLSLQHEGWCQHWISRLLFCLFLSLLPLSNTADWFSPWWWCESLWTH